MAAYVAMAHIVRARPHRPGQASGDAVERAMTIADFELDDDRVEERPFDDRLAERWSYIRDRWSQTTFYLFDAESWR